MSAPGSSPIGVFDSGVGGLTVYRALREVLPHEDFIYLGDTARLPYGTKSADQVAQYTMEAARFLGEQGIKLLVVACHTASAQAMPALREHMPDLPCLGLVAPTLEAAIKASHGGHVAVLATEGTVRSGVYPEMLHALRPGAEAETLACGRLVELAEEGKWDGAEAEATLTRTLGMLKPGFDTLVLGCTHFSLLAPALRKLLPPETALIDSAAVTARVVADFLRAHKLLDHKTGAGTSRFLATSEPERFARLARRFLNEDVAVERAALASTDKIVSITARRQ